MTNKFSQVAKYPFWHTVAQQSCVNFWKQKQNKTKKKQESDCIFSDSQRLLLKCFLSRKFLFANFANWLQRKDTTDFFFSSYLWKGKKDSRSLFSHHLRMARHLAKSGSLTKFQYGLMSIPVSQTEEGQRMLQKWGEESGLVPASSKTGLSLF